MFADLFVSTGRRSVPPRIVAVVMVLQKWHGMSDREAVAAFEFDARWKFACGGLDFDYPGFAHTVLVEMRARLARSEHPKRIFEVTLGAAREAGVVGAKRVLDSTPLYDAVATMDTVTLIRSAIRGLLRVADDDLGVELRAVCISGDGYVSAAKPQIDWEDADARDGLIDSRARDALACLGVLDGTEPTGEVAEAAELLATVVGQDIELSDDGTFRVIRGTAKDRIISTVDPDARHGPRQRLIVSMVTRAISRWILIRRSSPIRLWEPPTPGMPLSLPTSSAIFSSTTETIASTGVKAETVTMAVQECMAMPPTVPESSWTRSPITASTRIARPSRRLLGSAS
jgi:hypothetical protein